jgi:hypothetical protein
MPPPQNKTAIQLKNYTKNQLQNAVNSAASTADRVLALGCALKKMKILTKGELKTL